MEFAATIDTMGPAIRALARGYRAANPRIFGSVLHLRMKRGSDIDILVDALRGATLFDLGGLRVALEELLGAPVDLLTPEDLSPRFRERVLAESATDMSQPAADELLVHMREATRRAETYIEGMTKEDFSPTSARNKP